MLRFLILSGYFELVMYLQVSGKLNQYINIHYSYLAYISMILSFILAVVQLIVWMKQIKVHSHLSGRVAKVASIAFLAFPVLTGLLVPIYLYPDDFVGKKVSYTGFVYNDPQTKGYQFIFRFGIIHCIADSGVYGLATTGSNQTFKDNAWVTVTGTISVNYYKNLKQTLPILNLTEVKEVSQPDNPYVYRVF